MKAMALAMVSAAALASAACTTMDGSMDEPMATGATASADVSYVGGAAMYPTQTIVQNAQNSPIHTTLVKAVVAADLAGTLSGPGPFTVFAPTDDAFAKVPSATLNSLLQPAMKPQLTKVLTYHVVPGRVTASEIMAKIRSNGGTATYATVAGENLTFSMMGDRVMLRGMGGSMAHVTQADVMQSNGVIHVVDGVLLPSM